MGILELMGVLAQQEQLEAGSRLALPPLIINFLVELLKKKIMPRSSPVLDG